MCEDDIKSLSWSIAGATAAAIWGVAQSQLSCDIRHWSSILTSQSGNFARVTQLGIRDNSMI